MRKPFSFGIPNEWDDSDLTVYEFRVLAHYQRIGARGENIRETAEACGMSKSEVCKARQSLNSKGYIKIDSKPGVVYLIGAGDGIYKIGLSTNPLRRFASFMLQLPFRVKLVHQIRSSNPRSLERELHTKFKDKRMNGEWFRLSAEDVSHIKGM